MDNQNNEQETLVKELNDHVQKYPINLTFPATIKNKDKNVDSVRTDDDFINLRLLESGVLFDDGQNLGEATVSLSNFVNNLKETGCYNDVQVNLSHDFEKDSERKSSDSVRIPCKLNVLLDEKKWYHLYIGGGIKHESMEQSASNAYLPKIQFETNASLLNIRGFTDNTKISYSIDQTASADFFLLYNAPLFSLFPKHSPLYNRILLSSTKGTDIHFSGKAGVHVDDYEWTRSYKQLNRGIQFNVSNRSGIPDMVSGLWKSITYNLSFRDIMPRRHLSLPYACDASPDVVSQAGPNLKHSIQCTYRTNGEYTDNRFNPSEGVDYFYKAEIAGPPGDTGFIKMEGGYSIHKPLLKTLEDRLALHFHIQGGIMKPLDFGGLCHNVSCISDRFYIGGPLQLRGFEPSGIGPRANSGGKSTAGGDALGGEIYYNANISASIPPPIFANAGLRLFGFVNAGTLSNYGVPMETFLRSSRVSIGGGASLASPFGRVELTYGVPLRYGSKDVRKNFQFGFGFSFS